MIKWLKIKRVKHCRKLKNQVRQRIKQVALLEKARNEYQIMEEEYIYEQNYGRAALLVLELMRMRKDIEALEFQLFGR
ncbi:MAG: hypothetical protein DRH26_01325 [Deltaproteobacteria bacterium]|nr:MAG: hypothetical protein DRH26_01325 [Deltaproteobacteria bacterium]